MTSDEITEALMELFKKGAINVTYDENLEARFEITEEGQKAMESWNKALLLNPTHSKLKEKINQKKFIE